MNIDCRTFAREMDDLLDGGLGSARAGELRAHASACGACQVRLQAAVDLNQRLRQLPVPAPAPGYAARVFAAVRKSNRPSMLSAGLGFALAASVTAAVSLSLWFGQAGPGAVAVTASGGTRAPTLMLTLDEVKPVRLVFRSPRALTGVTVHLQLPDGVELEGFPDQRELSWQADLQAGPNSLDLPVIVKQGDGGVLTANLSYGQSHRQFSVLVQSRRSAVHLPEQVATVAAAVRGAFVDYKEVDHHA